MKDSPPDEDDGFDPPFWPEGADTDDCPIDADEGLNVAVGPPEWDKSEDAPLDAELDGDPPIGPPG